MRFKNPLFLQIGPLIAPACCDVVLYHVGINGVDNKQQGSSTSGSPAAVKTDSGVKKTKQNVRCGFPVDVDKTYGGQRRRHNQSRNLKGERNRRASLDNQNN